jgi:hypothetical protein
MTEPIITINGIILNTSQAMAVRVAITNFGEDLASDPDAFGTDDMGLALVKAYSERVAEVIRIMLPPIQTNENA